MDDPATFVYSAAKQAQRRYPTCSLLDLVREANDWVTKHPKKLEKAREEDRTIFFYNGIVNHCTAWALKDTALRFGYQPHDVYFYGLDVIANVVPGLFSDQYTMPKQDREEVRTKRDAAEGNNWPALLGDVGAAFKRCSDWTKSVLFDAYGLRVDVSTTEVDTALREMRDQLGGGRPQGCSRNCEECGDG